MIPKPPTNWTFGPACGDKTLFEFQVLAGNSRFGRQSIQLLDYLGRSVGPTRPTSFPIDRGILFPPVIRPITTPGIFWIQFWHGVRTSSRVVFHANWSGDLVIRRIPSSLNEDAFVHAGPHAGSFPTPQTQIQNSISVDHPHPTSAGGFDVGEIANLTIPSQSGSSLKAKSTR